MTFSGFTFNKKYVIINRNFNRWQSVILLKPDFSRENKEALIYGAEYNNKRRLSGRAEENP